MSGTCFVYVLVADIIYFTSMPFRNLFLHNFRIYRFEVVCLDSFVGEKWGGGGGDSIPLPLSLSWD